MSYEALFCPHCGRIVNGDWDRTDTPEDAHFTMPTNLGSVYTCGWCGIQTRDWDHVKNCRCTHTEKERLREKAAGQAALDMLKELGKYRKDRDET